MSAYGVQLRFRNQHASVEGTFTTRNRRLGEIACKDLQWMHVSDGVRTMISQYFARYSPTPSFTFQSYVFRTDKPKY